MVGMCHVFALMAGLAARTHGAREDARGLEELRSIECLRRPDSSSVRLCEAGLCAGTDGQCHRAANEAVASGFTLINARWPMQSLHLSPGKLSTSSLPAAGREIELDLFALPRKDGGEQTYVLASRGGTTAAACEPVGGGSSCVASAANASTAAALEVGVRLALAPWYEGAPPSAQTLTIEAVGSPGVFFAVDGFSQFHAPISAMLPDPDGSEILSLPVVATGGPTAVGVGSFWIADPPLPLELPPYAGPRCVLNCGAFGSGGAGQGSRRLWLVRFLAFCGFLLTLALGWLGFSLFHLVAECRSNGCASRRLKVEKYAL